MIIIETVIDIYMIIIGTITDLNDHNWNPLRCTSCSKPITGQGGTRFISFEGRHWHSQVVTVKISHFCLSLNLSISQCFLCALCKKSMAGRGFITGENKSTWTMNDYNYKTNPPQTVKRSSAQTVRKRSWWARRLSFAHFFQIQTIIPNCVHANDGPAGKVPDGISIWCFFSTVPKICPQA